MKYRIGEKVVMRKDATLNARTGIAGRVVVIVKIIGNEYWIIPQGLLVTDKQIEKGVT